MTVRLDHIVLNVRDLHSAIELYSRILQFEVERLDQFKAGAVAFPSVRINNETVIDLFPPKDVGYRRGRAWWYEKSRSFLPCNVGP